MPIQEIENQYNYSTISACKWKTVKEMKIKNFSLLLLLTLASIFAAGCTATQRAVIDPPSIGGRNSAFVEKVMSEKSVVTPRNKIRVKTDKYANKKVITEIDRQASEYLACMGSRTSINKIRGAIVYIVDTVFECEFHRTCAGELCRTKCDPDIIIVSYQALGKEGILPLLKHEWSHLDNNYAEDHSNLTAQLKKCIRYE